tara:strand:+ start:497 stop:676 length:180 start_codon:yes stop_codon:yes gene_type:complete
MGGVGEREIPWKEQRHAGAASYLPPVRVNRRGYPFVTALNVRKDLEAPLPSRPGGGTAM